MKNLIYLLIITSIPICIFSQNDKYYHYQGKIGKNMYVSANLQEIGGKLFGNYYYQIKSEDKILTESPIILLEGQKINKLYSFREKENKESYFEGTFFKDTKSLKGKWSSAGRKIPFLWEEKYKSSVPLSTVEINRFLLLKKGKEEPKATFSSTLFYPDKSNPKLYHSYIQFTKKMLELDTSIYNLFTLMAIYKDDFFELYKENNIGKYDNGERKGLNWSQKIYNKVYYNDNNILAVYFTKHINTGGTLDLEMIYTANFSLQNNKEINLEDIFIDHYQAPLQQHLAQQLRVDFMIDKEQSFTDIGFFTNEIPLATNYLLTNKGIIFFYNVYELAGNSFGKIEVFLDYKSLKSILRMRTLLKE